MAYLYQAFCYPDKGVQAEGPGFVLATTGLPHAKSYDSAFVDMLNAMRYGDLDQRTIAEFRKLSRPVKYEDGIEPTELCDECLAFEHPID